MIAHTLKRQQKSERQAVLFCLICGYQRAIDTDGDSWTLGEKIKEGDRTVAHTYTSGGLNFTTVEIRQ